jgi:hypothetical protein
MNVKIYEIVTDMKKDWGRTSARDGSVELAGNMEYCSRNIWVRPFWNPT